MNPHVKRFTNGQERSGIETLLWNNIEGKSQNRYVNNILASFWRKLGFGTQIEIIVVVCCIAIP